MGDRYDIYVDGVKTHESISEEEMGEVTQDLADEFYENGWPHPKDVEVKYLGHE